MHTLVVIPVWGEAFTELLVRHLLPSLADAGNLPALAGERRAELRLYTTPEDARRIRGEAIHATLERILPVRFVDIAELRTAPRTDQGRFSTMNACHLHAMRAAWDRGAELSFLAADNLLSDGSYARALEVFRDSGRALLAASLPVCLESFAPALERAHPRDAGGARRLAPRELMALALAHRHPMIPDLETPDLEIRGGFDAFKPMRWSLGAEGCLDHGWAGNPLLIRPRRLPETFQAVDVDYSARVLDSVEQLHFETDSDRVALIELMPRASGREHRPQPYGFTPLRFALGSEGLIFSEHCLHFARHGSRWHGGPCSTHWEACARRAGEAVDRTIAWMRFLAEPGQPVPDYPGAARETEATLDLLYRLARSGAAGPNPRQVPHAWCNLYKLQAALGQRGEALEAMAAVLDAEPPCPNPARALRVARAACRIGAWDMFRRALDAARAIDPLDPRIAAVAGLAGGTGA